MAVSMSTSVHTIAGWVVASPRLLACLETQCRLVRVNGSDHHVGILDQFAGEANAVCQVACHLSDDQMAAAGACDVGC